MDCRSDNPCVFGYTRTDGKQTLLVLLNFSDREAKCNFKVDGNVRLIWDTDGEQYSGTFRKKTSNALPLSIPAYGGQVYEVAAPSGMDV